MGDFGSARPRYSLAPLLVDDVANGREGNILFVIPMVYVVDGIGNPTFASIVMICFLSYFPQNVMINDPFSSAVESTLHPSLFQ